jgi:hypothetical protein
MPKQKADRDFGKRKHSISAAKVGDALGRSRMQKHKRTWPITSVSSADEGNSARASSEEDFHFQLQTLQDMFTSTRPVGTLYLRGEELDDSDLHPVLFPGDACPMTRLKDCNRPDCQARPQECATLSRRLHNISPQPVHFDWCHKLLNRLWWSMAGLRPAWNWRCVSQGL